MAALVRQLALVSESNSAGMSDLLRVSAALQKQASRDLAPIWELSATVDAFAKLEDVPDGYWPMIIKDDIGVEAAGVHKDKDGQPFALIASSPDFDNWALNCSHEMLEMLVDPSLDRQVTGDSPMDGQGRVSFLVEVCDPSGAADFGYSVNGILMSDFYTPHFFDPVASAAGVRYSFTGAITGPRQVLRGGYLSWKEPATGYLWQQVWFRGAVPTFRDLGSVGPQHASLRSFVDRFTAAAVDLQYPTPRCGNSKSTRSWGDRADAVPRLPRLADAAPNVTADRLRAPARAATFVGSRKRSWVFGQHDHRAAGGLEVVH